MAEYSSTVTARANLYRSDAGGFNTHSIELDSSSSQYLKIENFSDNFGDDGEDAASINFRFKLNSLPEAGQNFTIFTLGKDTEDEDDNIAIQVQIDEDGELIYTHEYGSGTNETITTSNMGLVIDTYYSITIWRDLSNSKISFCKGTTRTDYIAYAHAHTGSNNDLDLIIGCNLAEDGEYLDAKVDQFVISPENFIEIEGSEYNSSQLALLAYSELTSYWTSRFDYIWNFNYSFSSYVTHPEEIAKKFTPYNSPAFSSDTPFKAFINAKACINNNSLNTRKNAIISTKIKNKNYNYPCQNSHITSDGNLIVFFNHVDTISTPNYNPAQGIQAKISYNGGRTFCSLDGKEGSVSQIYPTDIDKEYSKNEYFDTFIDSEDNIYLVFKYYYDLIGSGSDNKVKLLKLTYNPQTETYSIGQAKDVFTEDDADSFYRQKVIKLNSTLYVFSANYQFSRDPQQEIAYKYSNDDGTTWSEVVYPIDDIGSGGSYVKFDVTVVGEKIFLVFEYATEDSILYTEYTTEWSTPDTFFSESVSGTPSLTAYYSKIFDWKMAFDPVSKIVGLDEADGTGATNLYIFNSDYAEAAYATEYNDKIYLFYPMKISDVSGAGIGIMMRTLLSNADGEDSGVLLEEQVTYVSDENTSVNYLSLPPYITDAWISKGFYFIPYFYINKDGNFVLGKYPIIHNLTAKARIRKGRFTTAEYSQITALTTPDSSEMLPPYNMGRCFFRTSDGTLIYIGKNNDDEDETIYFIKSTDNGENWSAQVEVLNTGSSSRSFSAYMDDDDVYFTGIKTDDGDNERIVFIKLTYSSENWSVGSEVEVAKVGIGEDMIVGDSNLNKIYQYDGFSTTVTTSFSSPSDGLRDTSWDGQNVLSTDCTLDTIYQHSGLLTTIKQSFSSPSDYPISLAWDGFNILSGDYNSSDLYKHSGFTTTTTNTFASPSTIPRGLVWDSSNLIHADSAANVIYKFSGFSSSITTSFTSPTTAVRGTGWDGENLYSTNYSNTPKKVYKHDGFSTTVTTDFDPFWDGTTGVDNSLWTGLESNSLTDITIPKIIRDGDDKLWIVYGSKNATTYKVSYNYSTDEGVTWSVRGEIAGGNIVSDFTVNQIDLDSNDYPYILVYSEYTDNLQKSTWNGSSWSSIYSNNEIWAIDSANPEYSNGLLTSDNKLHIVASRWTFTNDFNFEGRIVYSYAEETNGYLSVYPKATANYTGSYIGQRITMFERNNNIIAISTMSNNATNKVDLWFGELSTNGGTPPISEFLTDTEVGSAIVEVIALTSNLPSDNIIPVIVQIGAGSSFTMYYGEIELIEVGENLLFGKGNIKNFETGGLLTSKSNILPPTSFMNAVNSNTRIVKAKLEVMWDGLSWTDETSYFVSAQGSEQLDGDLGEGVATEADFEVDNTTKRFSPESSSPIKAYLKPRIPIRFSVDFGNVGYYLRLFTGYIKTYKPKKLSGICNFHCFDNNQYILNKSSRSTVYLDKRADQLIELLAQEAGLTETQYRLEQGSNIPVAWFDDRYINPLMNEITIAERGRIFFNRYGILEFWNRQHLSQIAISTFRTLNKASWLKNINYEISETSIKNRVVIQAKPRGTQPLQIVWSNKDPNLYDQYSETLLWIPAKNTQNAYLEITDPCINWAEPVANTDYVANTISDGSGTDKTNEIEISVFSPYANTIFMVVTNHSDENIYFTKFQVRAQPLPVASYIQVDAKDQNSIDEYGEQKIGPIENNFINDEDTARAIAYEELYRKNDTKYNFKADIVGDPLLTVGTVLAVEQEDASTTNYMIDKLDWKISEEAGFAQSIELTDPISIPKQQEVLASANIVQYSTETITAKANIT